MEELDDFSGSLTDSEDDYVRQVQHFKGTAATYRSLIEEERALHIALQELNNRNLAAHLYNAHCMRKRQYDSVKISRLPLWASKNSWRKEISEEEQRGDGWVPPKLWTAWPMPPDEVPRNDEQVGPGDGYEDVTTGHSKASWPSTNLEDILLGLTLRFARDRFESRKIYPNYEKHVSSGGKHITDDTLISTTAASVAGSVWPSSSAMSASSDDAGKDVGKDTKLPRRDSLSSHQTTFTYFDASGLTEDTEFVMDRHVETMSSEGLDIRQEDEEKPVREDYPIVSTDDELAAKILQPSLRHILSRLDDVLMALHHARNACFAYGSESGSQSEQEEQLPRSATNTQLPDRPPSSSAMPKRGRGRPKMVVILPVNTESNNIDTHEDRAARDGTGPPTRRGRGRPRKSWPIVEGETEHDRLLRIARLQKAKIPYSGKEPSIPRSRKTVVRRSPSPHTIITRRKQLNARDWSEVVGAAALIGLPSDVIARTTQRCADLFGEGMDLRRLTETSTKESVADDIEHYTPGRISEQTMKSAVMYSGPEAGMEPHVPVRSKSRQKGRALKHSTDIQVMHSSDSLLCPFNVCPRHSQGFHRKDNLRMHLKRAHDLTVEQANKAIIGSKFYNTRADVDEDEGGDEADLLDGVHIDGFLRHIPRQASWREAPSRAKLRVAVQPMEDSGQFGTSQSEGEIDTTQAVKVDQRDLGQSEEESEEGDRKRKEEGEGNEEEVSSEEVSGVEGESKSGGEEMNEDSAAAEQDRKVEDVMLVKRAGSESRECPNANYQTGLGQR